MLQQVGDRSSSIGRCRPSHPVDHSVETSSLRWNIGSRDASSGLGRSNADPLPWGHERRRGRRRSVRVRAAPRPGPSSPRVIWSRSSPGAGRAGRSDLRHRGVEPSAVPVGSFNVSRRARAAHRAGRRASPDSGRGGPRPRRRPRRGCSVASTSASITLASVIAALSGLGRRPRGATSTNPSVLPSAGTSRRSSGRPMQVAAGLDRLPHQWQPIRSHGAKRWLRPVRCAGTASSAQHSSRTAGSPRRRTPPVVRARLALAWIVRAGPPTQDQPIPRPLAGAARGQPAAANTAQDRGRGCSIMT